MFDFGLWVDNPNPSTENQRENYTKQYHSNSISMRLIYHFSEISVCFSPNPSENGFVLQTEQNNLKSEHFHSIESL